ncbi:septation protein A [Castellaniella sp.]|uniref:septation protein A n=1 Tax=Castellaniella sp. TaxID=1955812 RepID=UPI0035605C8F
MKKLLFDLFPLILFFVAFRVADIYVATGVAMAAAILQIGWLRLMRRPIETTHWINLGVIVIFGGATLLLHDDTFIKWKPTVLYWLFAAILAGARLFMGRNLMRRLMGEKIELPDQLWNRLNDSWVLFFTASGALNLYVAFSGRFTESQWVNFKVFGLLILLLLFVVVQSLWLGRHLQTDGTGLPAKDDQPENPS